MAGKASIQPNNATSAAGDYVERVQILDNLGNIVSGGVVDGNPHTAAGLTGVALYAHSSSATFNPLKTAQGIGDATDTTTMLGILPYAWTGTNADRIRTPNVFKSFASTAITAGTGATIWTPAAGKKFRLMGWSISTSVAGQLIFGDNLVATVITRTPALAAAGYHDSNDLGNGYVSTAANNVLKIDGPTGNIAGMVFGIEE